ncbi:MAG: DUF4430 domain-containing protein, partial [Clostridium luticellarii]|nr:DUF4430 domain-containing protein [Clostridium luticellarii]
MEHENQENKKKYAIAAVAFAVFAVLFALGLKANTLYSNTISNKQMSAQKEQKEPVSDSSNKAVNKDTGDKTKSSKSTNPSTVTSNGIVKVTAKDPESKCTFQIIDTVHGNKMIIAKDIDSSMDGQAVGYITERILDDAK